MTWCEYVYGRKIEELSIIELLGITCPPYVKNKTMCPKQAAGPKITCRKCWGQQMPESPKEDDNDVP